MHSYVYNISSFLIKMCLLFVVIVDVVIVVNVSHFYFFFSRTTWTIQPNISQSSLGKKAFFNFVQMKGNVLFKENVNLLLKIFAFFTKTFWLGKLKLVCIFSSVDPIQVRSKHGPQG